MITISEKANNRTSKLLKEPTTFKNHVKRNNTSSETVYKIFNRIPVDMKILREILEITFWR
jgi:hypothetical protein